MRLPDALSLEPREPMAAPDMRDASVRAACLLKTLANADRLLLLCQLTEGEKNVGELAELTGIVQPTLSQQLAVLRAEGLASTRRQGKQIFYSVASAEALAVLEVMFNLYCQPARKS